VCGGEQGKLRKRLEHAIETARHDDRQHDARLLRRSVAPLQLICSLPDGVNELLVLFGEPECEAPIYALTCSFIEHIEALSTVPQATFYSEFSGSRIRPSAQTDALWFACPQADRRSSLSTLTTGVQGQGIDTI